MGIFPKFRGEKKNIWNHQLATLFLLLEMDKALRRGMIKGEEWLVIRLYFPEGGGVVLGVWAPSILMKHVAESITDFIVNLNQIPSNMHISHLFWFGGRGQWFWATPLNDYIYIYIQWGPTATKPEMLVFETPKTGPM